MNWSTCTLCNLHKTRKKVVYGEGDCHTADGVLFVGEAPGKCEDVTGRPFCGQSGRVFDTAIRRVTEVLGRPLEYYITNIIGCRPPHNREPFKTEVTACKPRLLEIDRLVRPRIVFLMGKVAHKHGADLWPAHIKLVHPAYLLRTGSSRSPHFIGFVRRICDEIQRLPSRERIFGYR